MYRLHPQTAKLGALIAAGTIGDVRMIQASFGFQMPSFMPEHRLFANDLAGGGILDVGGYPVSMARFIAGAADGKPFLDPKGVRGTAHLGLEGTDEWAAAVLTFENGIVAQVACAVFVQLDNVLRIHGATGRIEVPDFWFAGGTRDQGLGQIDVIPAKGERQTISVNAEPHLYSFEIDAAGEAIRAGQQEFSSPGMSWADSLGNARVLDRWRKGAGLEYDIEKPARRTRTLVGRKLEAGKRIPRRALTGLSKPLSLVALGFEDFRTFSSGAILLDAFFEAGGNVFDTAFVYGAGYTETLFGDWHSSRGVREQSVLIGKGAHTPLCYPDMIGKQLTQSLERLKTDYVDVYFMHRDNPDVPVEEFIDAMDAEVKKGRIRGPFGGSNWERERIDAANAYAKKAGKQGFGALSNNFALAEMQDIIWPGCVSSSSDSWKEWLTARQIPNFAWSSQGRGFFTEDALAGPVKPEEVARVWHSKRNFVRRDHANQLAKELGKSSIHIALAYVLAQSFPLVPLIGPRTLRELDDSLQGVDIRLTPEQIKWLEA
jgi:aryl-alcohol dehydrogenase-like predicted oxidoreductase